MLMGRVQRLVLTNVPGGTTRQGGFETLARTRGEVRWECVFDFVVASEAAK